jgi:hypothetical protein
MIPEFMREGPFPKKNDVGLLEKGIWQRWKEYTTYPLNAYKTNVFSPQEGRDIPVWSTRFRTCMLTPSFGIHTLPRAVWVLLETGHLLPAMPHERAGASSR